MPNSIDNLLRSKSGKFKLNDLVRSVNFLVFFGTRACEFLESEFEGDTEVVNSELTVDELFSEVSWILVNEVLGVLARVL